MARVMFECDASDDLAPDGATSIFGRASTSFCFGVMGERDLKFRLHVCALSSNCISTGRVAIVARKCLDGMQREEFPSFAVCFVSGDLRFSEELIRRLDTSGFCILQPPLHRCEPSLAQDG